MELRCRIKNCVLLYQCKKMRIMNNMKLCSVFLQNCTGCFETDAGSIEGDGSSDYSHTVIGKYSFVNRTIKLWNQLPAEASEFPL